MVYVQLELSVPSHSTPAGIAHAIQEGCEERGISVERIHADYAPVPDSEALIHALMQTIKHLRGDRDALPYRELAKVVDGAMVQAVEVRA